MGTTVIKNAPGLVMRPIIFIICLMVISTFSSAQFKTDKKLQKKIESIIKGFQGDVGIYVKNVRTGKIVAINSDTIFPTASMIKVPVLLGVMSKIEQGELQYHQELIYKDSLLYAGEDILGSFRNDEKIKLSKVIMLMLTMSDNTASLWLQSLAGSGSRINELLDSLGFRDTRVNSRTPGRENNRTQYGWGQTTPKEMTILLEKIVQQEIFSKDASDRMMRVLGKNFWDERAISSIPPTVQVFSKNGAVNGSRSEVLFVNAPNNRYVFCICTKNIRDESWEPTNEAWQLSRKLSLLLWNYFKRRPG